jgi:hypothetical protein
MWVGLLASVTKALKRMTISDIGHCSSCKRQEEEFGGECDEVGLDSLTNNMKRNLTHTVFKKG